MIFQVKLVLRASWLIIGGFQMEYDCSLWHGLDIIWISWIGMLIYLTFGWSTAIS